MSHKLVVAKILRDTSLPFQGSEITLKKGQLIKVLQEPSAGAELPAEVFVQVPPKNKLSLSSNALEVVGFALAKNNYRAKDLSELNFRNGDLVEISANKSKEGFYFGRLCNSDEGYFPASVVELLDVLEAKGDYLPTGDGFLGYQTGQLIIVICRDTMKKGFWKGKVDKKIGLFPQPILACAQFGSRTKNTEDNELADVRQPRMRHGSPTAAKEPDDDDLEGVEELPHTPGDNEEATGEVCILAEEFLAKYYHFKNEEKKKMEQRIKQLDEENASHSPASKSRPMMAQVIRKSTLEKLSFNFQIVSLRLTKHGYLYKLNNRSIWQRRWFNLSKEGIAYYKTQTSQTVLAVIELRRVTKVIEDLNKRPNSFGIATAERLYELYADTTAEKDAWLALIEQNWLYCIKQQKKKTAGTHQRKGSGKTSAVSPVLKEGYLNKVGGQKIYDIWQKRWVVLNTDSISYSKKPGTTVLGRITLSEIDGIDVNVANKREFAFGVMLSHRTYFLQAENEAEKTCWVNLIQSSMRAVGRGAPQDPRSQPASPTWKPVDKVNVFKKDLEETIYENPESDDSKDFPVLEGVEKDFEFKKEVGRGGFSIVYEAVEIKTGEIYAIKKIEKSNVGDIRFLRREIHIMFRLNHPNILKLYSVYEEEHHFYLIMEFVNGKELFNVLVDNENLSERMCRSLFYQLTLAIQYLHENEIAHRDLKAENILIFWESEMNKIKLIDFGLAKSYGGRNRLVTRVGTPSYIAPELIVSRDKYSSAVDMWSLGVLLYIMLSGRPPFTAETRPLLYQKIQSGRFDFSHPLWDNISSPAKDLISHLLERDPKDRFTSQQCLHHPWLEGNDYRVQVG